MQCNAMQQSYHIEPQDKVNEAVSKIQLSMRGAILDAKNAVIGGPPPRQVSQLSPSPRIAAHRGRREGEEDPFLTDKTKRKKAMSVCCNLWCSVPTVVARSEGDGFKCSSPGGAPASIPGS